MTFPYDENLFRVSMAEYNNGFGFQPDAEDDAGNGAKKNTFIFLKYSLQLSVDKSYVDQQNVQKLIREKTESKSARVFDWIGRKFVEIDAYEWELIPAIFQTLIDIDGFQVYAHCKNDCMFEKGERFSYEALEQKAVDRLRNYIKEFGLSRAIGMFSNNFAYKKHYNWRTEEGKKFCTELRAALHLKEHADFTKAYYLWRQFDETCRKYAVLHRGKWSAYEPSGVKISDFLLPRTQNVDSIEKKRANEGESNVGSSEKKAKK